MNTDSEIKELFKSSLESARQALSQQLQDGGKPLTSTPGSPMVHTDYQGGFSVGGEPFDLRPHVSELAAKLDDSSDLGRRAWAGDQTHRGVSAVLFHYVGPVAMHYLNALPDLSKRDDAEIERLYQELQGVIGAESNFDISQLVIGGVSVTEELTHRGISLRPLTTDESQRVEARRQSQDLGLQHGQDLILPTWRSQWEPTALLEIRSKRGFDEAEGPPAFPNSVLLAFYLYEFDICALGISSFASPRWTGLGEGIHGAPLPITLEHTVPKPVDQELFQTIIDLAFEMPEFAGYGEEDSHQLLLMNALTGLGVRSTDRSFIDCALALEGALLGGIENNDELSYRFALYGSLFLQDQLPPKETFKRLKGIYNHRSFLVHGSRRRRSASTRREAAEAVVDARKLVRMVLIKAIH